MFSRTVAPIFPKMRIFLPLEQAGFRVRFVIFGFCRKEKEAAGNERQREAATSAAPAPAAAPIPSAALAAPTVPAHKQ